MKFQVINKLYKHFKAASVLLSPVFFQGLGLADFGIF